MEERHIDIAMGQYSVTRDKQILTAAAIGSCLVVTLYDRKKRIGGMAHATLPTRNSGSNESGAAYVDSAIDAMLHDLQRFGAHAGDIESKIVGGSNMFPSIAVTLADIGSRNVDSARKKLRQMGISLVGQSVGGTLGRSVEFCPHSGIVTVKIKF